MQGLHALRRACLWRGEGPDPSAWDRPGARSSRPHAPSALQDGQQSRAHRKDIQAHTTSGGSKTGQDWLVRPSPLPPPADADGGGAGRDGRERGGTVIFPPGDDSDACVGRDHAPPAAFAALVVVTFNRPDYLARSLDSLLTVHGADPRNRCAAPLCCTPVQATGTGGGGRSSRGSRGVRLGCAASGARKFTRRESAVVHPTCREWFPLYVSQDGDDPTVQEVISARLDRLHYLQVGWGRGRDGLWGAVTPCSDGHGCRPPPPRPVPEHATGAMTSPAQPLRFAFDKLNAAQAVGHCLGQRQAQAAPPAGNGVP